MQETSYLNDVEMLAVCRALLSDTKQTSLFAKVKNADEIATVIKLIKSADVLAEALTLLCDSGVIWQVLIAALRQTDPEALYDEVGSLLPERWDNGSQAVRAAASWALLNRRHNTYEWINSALHHVTDVEILKHAADKWPDVRQTAMDCIESIRRQSSDENLDFN